MKRYKFVTNNNDAIQYGGFIINNELNKLIEDNGLNNIGTLCDYNTYSKMQAEEQEVSRLYQEVLNLQISNLQNQYQSEQINTLYNNIE